jgi:hypothetical protein
MESPETITRISRVWLAEDGILRNVCLAGVDQELVDAQETIAIYEHLWGGIRRPLLVDMSRVRSISRGARACYAEESPRTISAVALVVGTPLSRMIGNFFLGLNRSPQPTRLFRTTEDAEAWCLQFIDRGTP